MWLNLQMFHDDSRLKLNFFIYNYKRELSGDIQLKLTSWLTAPKQTEKEKNAVKNAGKTLDIKQGRRPVLISEKDQNKPGKPLNTHGDILKLFDIFRWDFLCDCCGSFLMLMYHTRNLSC